MATDTHRWNSVKAPIYPWVKTIESILSAQHMPNLDGPIINVFSDYAGEHKASAYDVTGVLYLDLEASLTWELQRRVVRSRYLADGRRMAFKSLNDRKRRAALIPFLESADQIPGLLLVVAVRKTLGHLCLDAKHTATAVSAFSLRKTWRPREFERLLRLAHLIGLLIGGLSRPKQDIYWFSDEDALFANEPTALDVRDMVARFSSHYVTHSLGELGLGTSAIDPGDRYEEDALGVVDLAIGAITETINALSRDSGGSICPSLATPLNHPLTRKSDLLLDWFYYSQSMLKKVCIVFEQPRQGGMAGFRLDLAA